MLRSILEANRAEPVEWIEKWLIPTIEAMGYGVIVDEEHNVYVKPVNGASRVLFVAHTDTVDVASAGDRTVHEFKGHYLLAKDSKNRCLGADDGAGVYVLLQLLDHGVDGGFLFTTGEESGGIGVTHFQEANPDELKRYDMAFEFDRYGKEEIIIEQGQGECASLDFGMALSDAMDKAGGMTTYPSDAGLYTDVADLAEIIPECVNVCIGYNGHHSSGESVDIKFVETIVRVFKKLHDEGTFLSLPIKRIAGDYGETYGYGSDIPWWEKVQYGGAGTLDPLTPDTGMIETVKDFVEEYPAFIAYLLSSTGYELAELYEIAKQDDWDVV